MMFDASVRQGRRCEMAEIVDAESLDASKLCHTPKPFPQSPRVRSFEITFEPRVRLAGITYSWWP
jgi:hypothetical protein